MLRYPYVCTGGTDVGLHEELVASALQQHTFSMGAQRLFHQGLVCDRKTCMQLSVKVSQVLEKIYLLDFLDLKVPGFSFPLNKPSATSKTTSIDARRLNNCMFLASRALSLRSHLTINTTKSYCLDKALRKQRSNKAYFSFFSHPLST